MKSICIRVLNNKWFHLLMNAAIFALMAGLLPIHFEANDDVAMCAIASGKYSGAPDGHIVYINALFGWLLAGLYSLTRAVEWYTVVFCVVQVVAMTGITYAFVTERKLHIALKVLLIVFLYVFWARIIIAFQFTTTTGLLCASGCIALLKPNRKWHWAGFLAIVVASLLRLQAAAMVGLLFAPMLLARLLDDKKLFSWLIVTLLLVFLGYVGDRLCYRSPEWKEYMEYNALRAYINDNPNADLAEWELPEGIDKDDYQMLHWFSVDPQVIDKEDLQAIKSVIRGRITLKSAVSNLTQLLGYATTLAMLSVGYVLLIMAIVLSEKERSRRQRFVALAPPILTLLIFWMFVLYFGITAVLKPRAFFCLLLPVVCQMLMQFPVANTRRVRMITGAMACLMAVMTIKYVKQVDKVNKLYHAQQEEFDTFIYPLIQNRTDALHGGLSEYLSPFAVKDIAFRPVSMGWMTKIPFNKGVMESHLDYVDSGILYLSGADGPPTGISNSIERNYGVKVAIETVDSNEKYALYKFVSQ